LKNIEFRLKTSKGFCLRFYQQTSVHGENGLKIWIPSTWGSYSILFRYFSVVHKLLGLLKNIKFWLKSQRGLVFNFIKKYLFVTKTGWKSVFLHRETHFLPQLDVKVLYMIFMGFKKYWDSAQNSKELAFDFTKKMFVHHENMPKFHPHEAHILS
jgi:hypothetical protein